MLKVTPMGDDLSDALPPLPRFAFDEKVCGNCKLWGANSVDHRGWVGLCRAQESRGLFPPSAPICDAFAPRAGVVVSFVAQAPTRGSAERSRPARTLSNVGPMLRRPRPDLPVDLGGEQTMTREELMDLFREASGQVDVPLAQKWEGGVIQLVPGKSELQGKELPIDALFHKVVMVRDRLRTLEQKINAHPKLSDAEKVDMQQYITRVYGSLTNFNVLFRDKSDQFVGAKEE